jgi:hypothetical protein
MSSHFTAQCSNCARENLAPIVAAFYRQITRYSLSHAKATARSLEDVMSTDDRRAPGATRIPFEALVEVGGALGPSFEAQAINISEEGMHLRTAYLPDIGQPLSCRFDAGTNGTVIASGEVVWKEEAGKGGEFGIRFTDLDSQSAESLQKMMGIGFAPPPPAKGNRVRLHIEGLGSPMRAHVKESSSGKLTAFSGLGFLQVGKHLELEDATTGAKRPAKVVRVECEIDPESRVPQLVMSFQYEDQEQTDPDAQAKEDTPEPMVTHDEPAIEASAKSAHRTGKDDDDAIERESGAMKGFVARSAAKVTPAIERMFERAKTTMAVLAAKRRGGSGDDVAIPLRRRTSPPPQGALHSSGRKVIRDSLHSAKEIPDGLPTKAITPRRVAIVGTAATVLAIAFFAMHKPSAPSATVATDAVPGAPQASGGQPLAPTTAEPLTAPPSVLAPVTTTSGMQNTGATTAGASEVAANDVLDESSDHGHKKTHVAPFSNGAVAHGNVLRIKMDGAIEKIEGDSQPTGFTVVIPGRRSLEPAAPLAARDSRIASIRVTNDGPGAELTVAFKDGVPNYLVRAKADELEIVLAPAGSLAEATRPHAAPTTRHHKKKH